VTVVLWHIELSHYNEKVRWALDYKAIPHERRVPMPGLHRLSALALTRGRHDRLPVAEIDGRRIGDSTAIIAALEAFRPQPALYPADAGERARALALEDFFDEQLAPEVRRWMWHHTLPDTSLVVDSLLPADARARRRLLSAFAPLGGPIIRRDYGIDDEHVAAAAQRIRAAMDRLEAEIGPSGYLAGESFTVADLSAAALFTPLLSPPGREHQPVRVAPAVMEFRTELAARPGGEWVDEMYRRHRAGAR
jgi:glutathione S-transferase